MSKQTKFKMGSENVFADLGFPNPEEHLLKAQLVHKISTVMKERKLTQVEAARIIGVKQPDISNLVRGQFRVVSVEKLMHYLVALGHDVEIVVKPHRDSEQPAQLTVA
ncbi:transcriptional regulator, XRE family [Rhizobiales bacterium GAS188]|jgi:predicted XRE-type DNA-binding protein|nr:transcriptional regulator, XRE family [Rhizobiales bacterium GAS188]